VSPAPVVGVDVGGTKVAALVVERDPSGAPGRLLCRTERAMAGGDPGAGVARIADTIREAIGLAGLSLAAIEGVGVGVPGQVDAEAGIVEHAVNLDWTGVGLRDLLVAELGIPCSVENDVRVAAAGLAQGLEAPANLAYLAVGTGIGAGIVIDGRLHRGPRGMAGEVGHVILEPDGEVCACGLRGCLETIASGPAVARSARERLAAGRRSVLDPQAITTEAVYRASAAGDGVAMEVVGRAGRALARAIHTLVMTCDLERVYLGGGVARAGDAFLGPVQAELDVLRSMSPLTNRQITRDTIVLLPRDYDAVARGAAALAGLAALSGAPAHAR
jgi:predicted NBD/HSP70 family sugar kinase